MTDLEITTYRIQTDEETGGDETWDALHDYADSHPAPTRLAPFVDRDTLGDFNGVVVPESDGLAAIAWLAAAAEALGVDERTTPVLVTTEADCNCEITVDLDTPNGPVVEYGPDDDEESVEASLPPGWAVSWGSPAYKLSSGRYRLPLIRE